MGRPFLTNEDFNAKLKALGKGYTLREGEYTGTKTRYNVICPNHQENLWMVLGSNLLQNSTCPLCSDEKQSLDKRLSHEDVVKLFEKDGRGFKIRDGFKYTTNKDETSIVCPEHPEYEWVTRPLDVIYGQKKCPVCRGQVSLSNKIIDERLKDKEIVRMSEYLGYAQSKMIFKCVKDGYEWETSVSKVVNDGTGCPKCSNKVPWTNSRVDDWLLHNTPTIERISDVLAVGTQTRFKCLVDGYEWSSEFGNLRNGYGCPCCRTTKYWNTELAMRWLKENKPHITVVGELNGVSRKSTFRCSIHNIEFDKKLSHFRNGYDCPECSAGGGFKTTLKAYLYYAKVVVADIEFFKIGITNRTPEIRVKETKQGFEILKSYEFGVGAVADNLESQLLHKFKHLIQTEHKFSGSTECFTEDIRNYIDLDKFVCNHIENSSKD